MAMPSSAARHYSDDHQAFVQQRSTPRHSLMLRTAKVICQCGEYPCLVRDVSQGGVGLRFFHETPAEARIFLELANGAIFPIERVWADGPAAGYRFATPVAVRDFLDEAGQFPHRAVRLRLQAPVLLTVGGEDCKAELVDISRCGAKVIADRELPEAAFVRFDAKGLPLRFGHIRWRKGAAHGVVFQQSIPLDELARCLAALRPSGPADGDGIRAA